MGISLHRIFRDLYKFCKVTTLPCNILTLTSSSFYASRYAGLKFLRGKHFKTTCRLSYTGGWWSFIPKTSFVENIIKVSRGHVRRWNCMSKKECQNWIKIISLEMTYLLAPSSNSLLHAVSFSSSDRFACCKVSTTSCRISRGDWLQPEVRQLLDRDVWVLRTSKRKHLQMSIARHARYLRYIYKGSQEINYTKQKKCIWGFDY